MTGSIRLLYVDSDREAAEPLTSVLSREHPEITVRTASHCQRGASADR